MGNTRTCKSMHKLTAYTQRLINAWMKECEKVGLNIYITETFRSEERQEYLYSFGRTRAGSIRTWAKKPRMHGSGRAADFCLKVGNKLVWDSKKQSEALDIANKMGLSDLRPYEYSHVENRNYETVKEVPDWAQVAWAEANSRGIIGGDPHRVLSEKEIQWALKKAGVIKEVEPITAYRMAVILEKMGKL